MEYYWDDLEEGLKVLTDVTYRLVEEYVKAGVDGIFYASQHMYDKVLTPDLYERLVPYDLQAAEPALKGCWFNMLHVHGDTHMFFEEIAQRYPFQAFNWEDILSGHAPVHSIQSVFVILPGPKRWREHILPVSCRTRKAL